MSHQLADDWVEITVNTCDIAWFRARGYSIPTRTRQLWARNRKGLRTKNGVKECVAKRAKLRIRREDLPPNSNRRMTFSCVACGSPYQTTWRAYRDKKSKDCKSCASKRVKETGCHSYWVKRLITDNPIASCDMCGETDKRFLVLHHLKSTKVGGKNEEANYVILTANWHLAFHVSWMGGMKIPCHPEDYVAFKAHEKSLQ